MPGRPGPGPRARLTVLAHLAGPAAAAREALPRLRDSDQPHSRDTAGSPASPQTLRLPRLCATRTNRDTWARAVTALRLQGCRGPGGLGFSRRLDPMAALRRPAELRGRFTDLRVPVRISNGGRGRGQDQGSGLGLVEALGRRHDTVSH
jgi:hypothetical protein